MDLKTKEDHYQHVAECAEQFVHTDRMAHHGPVKIATRLVAKHALFAAVDAMVEFIADP